ncbi:XRE family transcriptional regulator [Lusitaniella coriacea LEGE 07157]|uniref:XRE family transcriptional regulator n=1 Tax=Lusitaniella coriacea LEGE 07157 TaxID=945747 RepID=A0A8J7B6L3_9CYAN|nr:XRE family transcriptional regulator [Lusitaniella coriacea]MBE9114436.1 XRE family transcriptional regulator [Lusitaniella coriacea LEGE 07157]
MTPDELITISIESGSDNLFEDIGFTPEEAASLKIKSDLALKLRQHLEEQRLDSDEITQFFGSNAIKIEDIIEGELDRFTIEELVALLLHIGLQVKVEISPLV